MSTFMAEAPFGGAQTGLVIHPPINAENPGLFAPELFDQDPESLAEIAAAAQLVQHAFAKLCVPDAEVAVATDLLTEAQTSVGHLSPVTRAEVGGFIISSLVRKDLAERASAHKPRQFPEIEGAVIAEQYQGVRTALAEARNDRYTPGQDGVNVRLYVAAHGLAVPSDHIDVAPMLSKARASMCRPGIGMGDVNWREAAKTSHEGLLLASRSDEFRRKPDELRAALALGLVAAFPEFELAD